MKMLVSMLLTLGIILFSARYMMGGMGSIPGMESVDKATKGMSELGNAVLDKDVTVYQWTDADGVTHFGGTPPTGQGQYEKKTIHSNTNLMQAQKRVKEEEEPSQQSQVARVGSLYSPAGVKDLMDNAKGLKDQANERTTEQEKLLESIMNPSGKK